MDLSLKQRLLGAAVLIALAVIFIPMLLSPSAPRDPAALQSSDIAIPPEPSAEFQTRVLPTTPEPLPTPSAPGPDRLATVDTATAPKPEVATPLPTPAASTPAVADTAPAPAAAAPAEPPAAPGRAADGRWFVHLGVYGAAGNATDLVAALKKGGFPAFDEATTWQGKAARRVRVGPYADRAAAETARLKIKQARPQVPGSVVEVASDAKTDAPASALPAGRAGGWVVQVGALKAEADANTLRDRLKGAGFVAFVDKVNAEGGILWRVRAGPEVDRGAADKLRDSIKDKLKLDGIVVVL